jgi:hypothetical protein
MVKNCRYAGWPTSVSKAAYSDWIITPPSRRRRSLSPLTSTTIFAVTGDTVFDNFQNSSRNSKVSPPTVNEIGQISP